MIGFGMSGGKQVLSVEHVQVVALYEPESGKIRHVHMVTTLAGAARVTEEEAVAEAVRRAGRRHPNAKELAVALSNDADHGYRPHCIDPKTKAFVLMPDARSSRPNEGTAGA
jgi:hypothetical protein